MGVVGRVDTGTEGVGVEGDEGVVAQRGGRRGVVKERQERERGRRKGVWKAVYGSMTIVLIWAEGREGKGKGRGGRDHVLNFA